MIDQLTIFSNRQFRWATYIVIVLAAVLILVNLFLIGGDTFVFSFNSSINAPIAIVVTIAALTAWRKVGTEKRSQLLWAGIVIGWGLWALAEIIYSIYSIVGQEAPYPSIADIFWMIGYVPMGVGLFLRGRTMPVRPNRSQVLTIVAFSLITILFAGIFVLWPTFQSFDPGTPMENLINIAYPLEDCLLLIVVWRLFFTYEKGESGFGWRLLAVGFILLTIGDLVYLYANSTDPILYYPDLKANLISRFGADVPYSLSYLSWLLGIFALRVPAVTAKEEPVPEEPIWLKRPQKYGHMLIFTKYDNTVIDVSSNFNLLFGSQTVEGRPLAHILKISEEAGRTIHEKVKAERKLTDLPVQIPENALGIKQGWLCGIAVFNPQGEYSGANLLLSVPVSMPLFDESLNEEHRMITRRLGEATGTQCKEDVAPFLLGYYLPFIKGLYHIALGQGGPKMASALLDELSKKARANSWQIGFNPETVMEAGSCPWEVLRKALPALLETAKEFVASITDKAVVETTISRISSRFDANVQRDIAAYDLSV